ncbi:osteopontin isoform X1 [Sander lucioperca]|uniref:osteopontin isoform X1 n=1 Tax=Sander lucioperca TaxID=283035 RepID=UPI00125E0AC6|nr:osteopontin isoform X1 [Sander lucioperca]
MKVAVIFVLLFATVLCRPARKVSVSSSESSEEAARRPAAPALRKQVAELPQNRAAPVQNIVAEAAPAAASSDESPEGSDEDEQAAAEAPIAITSDSTDTTSSPDTATVNSEDDDDDDDDDAEESETDEDESSDSSESGEASTPAPATDTPVVVTEEPVAATTPEPIVPTIVTDADAGRGDSLGGYPSDYKSIVYVEDKSYQKVPSPYKSYEFIGTGKKMAYDMTEGNEVEKSLTVYKVKALQVHSDLMEEDTSTPEVESQGLDASSGTSQDQELSPRQASLPEEEESASTSDATTSESSSAPEQEEEEESASTGSDSASDSASASQETEDEESQSSEEATATPGAADSESDESTESDSDEEGAGPDTTTDMPVVITAK